VQRGALLFDQSPQKSRKKPFDVLSLSFRVLDYLSLKQLSVSYHLSSMTEF
jgi:hypothetical protein